MELVFPPPPPNQPPSTSLPLPHRDAYPEEPREYARALMQRKDEIEKEIHGTTPNTSLVDPEGYPRGDIDIYAIRHARSALVRLQNDRQQVSDLLATALEDAFSISMSSSGSSSSGGLDQPNGHAQASPLATEPRRSTNTDANINGDAAGTLWPERAIARVNSVALESPASQAVSCNVDLLRMPHRLF
ncbi:26S proteasome non-ATPase regulatory subunit 9 [Kwoniella heveanensis BCC8398]|uniref:26S proteasome non-ATPase regulatory subunit 9 n=1 Tax=Kwoniella heveanensis BCC8398 TaxID=1296120 RepID=A0A1B9GPX4_9TREE|nr:26S proteasome non-ATPase regulatory subunit 9 [Kwoniella heveanensis BCC8398]